MAKATKPDGSVPLVSQTHFVSNNSDDIVDWLVGTVILTFFPIIISMIISLCRSGTVDISRMIGDGELILSSFLVITPSIMNYYREGSIQKETSHKVMFYLLLFVAFFQLTAYTSIKTNTDNNAAVVYITSALCVISSVYISWQGENILRKGSKK